GREESSCPSFTYVVPSSSSARLNSRAASGVAGLCPTTPISRRTRSRPLRRATRPTSRARLARWILAPTAGSCQSTPHRGRELGDRDSALELRLDPAVGADEEDPRLGRRVRRKGTGADRRRGGLRLDDEVPERPDPPTPDRPREHEVPPRSLDVEPRDEDTRDLSGRGLPRPRRADRLEPRHCAEKRLRR